ncbi:SMI1/KNR4 family protein [Flavobacterium phycosphaerae]|uniref:SMI1/KNR4 family protein n=1 Tax=Flavobacterium phycosphaerae TaxID=2697515 RepID=UPI001389F3BE|nr:SMI1/KNR4 family protein [Flavobacterium phycosphaerae]
MTANEYDKLENSMESFELIKRKSEEHWRNKELDLCWGYQVQKDSIWRNGLSEKELDDFQKLVNIEFPQSLKNFYRTMNGLDKPGINLNGGEEKPSYYPTFYSYPEDIPIIQKQIEIAFSHNPKEIQANSRIFPYFGHRFLDFTEKEKVLSIYFDDILDWEENLAKAIAKDIFDWQ